MNCLSLWGDFDVRKREWFGGLKDLENGRVFVEEIGGGGGEFEKGFVKGNG